MSARKVVIEFLGDTRDLVKAVRDVDTTSGKLGTTLKGVGKMAAYGLGAGIAVAGAAFVKFGIDSTQSLARIERINAQTETAIRSTGGAAGVTGKHVENLAGKIETLTASEAESVQEGANLLLTFTNIQNKAGAGNKIFDQATGIMNDMSVALGQDMKSSAIQLGKALNDPIKGVTALQRVGVSFTDGQKETIKSLVESGKTMDAQKLILRELTKEFGGSGEAFAQTAQGKLELVKHKFGEIGEEIFSKLLPRLADVADWFLNSGLPAFEAFGGWITSHVPPIFERIQSVVSTVMGALQGDVGGGLGRVQQIFTDVTSIVTSLWDRFGGTLIDYATKTWANMQQIVGGALDVVSGIFKTFAALLKGDWSGAWDGIKLILSGAWEVIKGLVKQSLNIVGTLMEVGWSAAKGIVSGAWDGIKTAVSNGIGKVVDWVQEIPGKFRSALSNLKETASEIFSTAMNAGKEKVVNIGQDIVGWVADIPGKLRDKIGDFKSAGAALIGAVVDGMKNAGGVIEGIASNVWTAVRGLLNAAIDKINRALEFSIDLPLGRSITINPTDIPHLARGTSNWRGGLAVVGEEGPELVNLPRGSRVTPHGESMGALRGMGGGSGAPTIVQLVVGGRVLEQILIQHTRDTGEPLQVRTLGPVG